MGGEPAYNHKGLIALDVEMSVLGAMMASPGAARVASKEMDATAFSEPLHQEMFRLILRRIDAKESVSGHVMAKVFEVFPALKDLGGAAAYVTRLAASAAPESVMSEYIGHLIDLARRRDAIEIMSEGQEEATDQTVKSGEVISGVIERLTTANLRGGSATMKRLDEDDALALLDTSAPAVIKTGLADVDRMAGGMPAGEMTVLAGRPGMGKSAVMIATAANVARKGRPVAIFSLEMPRKAVLARLISSEMMRNRNYMAVAPIPYAEILRGNTQAENLDAFHRAAEAVTKLPIHVDDFGGVDIESICALALRWADEQRRNGHEPGFIAIDHIGLVKTSRYFRSPYEAMTAKAHAAMRLSRESGVAVLVLSQLSRVVEQRNEKRPILSDLRDSGALEENASLTLFAYREAYYLEQQADKTGGADDVLMKLEDAKNKMEMIVAKCRNGPTGVARLYCDIGFNHIASLASYGGDSV